MSKVGYNIKRIRKERKISQKELGEMLGVSQAAIGQFESENSNPKIETLEKIAKCLSVSLAELLNEKDNATGIFNGEVYQGSYEGLLRFEEVKSINAMIDFLTFFDVRFDKENHEFIFDDSMEKYQVEDIRLLAAISAKQIKVLISEFGNKMM